MSSYTAVTNGFKGLSKKYGPAVMDQAKKMVAQATDQKVVNLSDAQKYVGSSPERLSVVTHALNRAGVSPDDLVPPQMVGDSAALGAIRQGMLDRAQTMAQRFDAGSDHSFDDNNANETTAQKTGEDVVRKRRVQVALRVYGSADAYFLCHPNGGIPRTDFDWYKSLFGR